MAESVSFVALPRTTVGPGVVLIVGLAAATVTGPSPIGNTQVFTLTQPWVATIVCTGDGANGSFPAKADVVIVNYDVLVKHRQAIDARQWDILVADEVHYAKNPKAQRTREILGYHMREAKKAERISRRLNSSYPAHQYPITSREARRIGLNVKALTPELDGLLQELNLLYSEMGQRAITDYDELNHHDNEITNILEGRGLQVFYQVEKDWYYRKEERRWVPLNDVSAWYRCRKKDGRVQKTKFHIR